MLAKLALVEYEQTNAIVLKVAQNIHCLISQIRRKTALFELIWALVFCRMTTLYVFVNLCTKQYYQYPLFSGHSYAFVGYYPYFWLSCHLLQMTMGLPRCRTAGSNQLGLLGTSGDFPCERTKLLEDFTAVIHFKHFPGYLKYILEALPS